MKKFVALLFFSIFCLNFVIAANLQVDILDKKDVVIIEDNNNATYTLSITSEENITDTFEMYTLVGVAVYPKSLFTISPSNFF